MIRYGIIGCGGIGRKRAAAMPAGALRAVYDIHSDAAAKLAAESGAQAVAAPEKVWTHSEVDAVIVATTHEFLASLARDAVLAGKPVLVEKPAACSAVELQPLIDAARARNGCVRVGYNHRFHPALRRAKQLAEAGEIGDLFLVRGRYGHGGRLGYEKEWRADKTRSGGGELIDQGVHLIDLAGWLLGEFPRVRGTLRTHFWKMPVEDQAFMELETAKGEVAWLHASCAEWKNLFSLEIYGRTGKIQIDGLGGSYGPETLRVYRMKPEMGPPAAEETVFAGSDQSWKQELEEFERDIREKRNPRPGLEDALAVLRITDTIYAANRT